jgi:hypothetical protein
LEERKGVPIAKASFDAKGEMKYNGGKPNAKKAKKGGPQGKSSKGS